jgi:hypothetical protein
MFDVRCQMSDLQVERQEHRFVIIVKICYDLVHYRTDCTKYSIIINLNQS